jgi:hypothetical protein
MYEVFLIYLNKIENEKGIVLDDHSLKEQINCFAEIIVNNLMQDHHVNNYSDQSITS